MTTATAQRIVRNECMQVLSDLLDKATELQMQQSNVYGRTDYRACYEALIEHISQQLEQQQESER